MATGRAREPEAEVSQETIPEVCGIVMPISAIEGCTEDHWRDVKGILAEAILDAGFAPQLVSDADDVGIIQKRIIQNLYENPIVVCDVSAKNPNVMFELGMRLAFDRPTIIVKDDKTSYSFDTSPVEHLAYPRDLRFSKIVEFKAALAEKIKATYEKSKSDPNFTTFLKHFGTFKVAEIQTEIVSEDRIVLEEVRSLRELVTSALPALRQRNLVPATAVSMVVGPDVLCLRDASDKALSEFEQALLQLGTPFMRTGGPQGHAHFDIRQPDADMRRAVLATARRYCPEARWLGSRRKLVD